MTEDEDLERVVFVYFEELFVSAGFTNGDLVLNRVLFKVSEEMNKLLCEFYIEEEVFEVLK